MKRASITRFALALAATVLLHVAPVQADTEPRADKVLHSFQNDSKDGIAPWAGLIDVDGTLYGTTLDGGTYCPGQGGCGTVFSLNPKTGATSILYSFQGLGTFDGQNPEGGVIYFHGLLYGTTSGGGLSGLGTIFAVDPKTGAETFEYSFGNGNTDGFFPAAGLLNVNGTLYGTTLTGANGTACGTVFTFHPKTGKERTVYAFKENNDGCFPAASLINVKGKLYGTTDAGQNLLSTVFSINLSTGREKVVFQFTDQAQGLYVDQPVVELHGLLYGTAQAGGANSYGDVFAVDPKTGTQTVLYSFCSKSNCSDGDRPYAGLIVVKGILYGTTGDGGTTGCNNRSGCGVVYSLDPNTGVETVLHTFQGAPNDGGGSQAPLLLRGDKLYGTTIAGGTGEGNDCPSGTGCGTVFLVKR